MHAIQQAVDLRPEEVSGLIDLGVSAYAAGRADEAVSHLRQAVERDPGNPVAYRALIDVYRTQRYCWVIVGSDQKLRGLKANLPGARTYYARLDRESDRTQLFDPWRPDSKPPGFNFDWSFDFYPRAYARPGPLVEVHHLRSCK